MVKDMTTAIWWIRSDLRLHDNPALSRAISEAETVLPLFILDPVLLGSEFAAEQRTAFMLAGLKELGAAIANSGGRLIVRTGSPSQVLHEVRAESHAAVIYATRDASPYARSRDEKLAAELPLELLPGSSIRPLGTVTKQDGSPYTVFTPFLRAWFAAGPVGYPLHAPGTFQTPASIKSEQIPEQPAYRARGDFLLGETAGLSRLDGFTGGSSNKLLGYDDTRDSVGEDGTSRLSPYLRFGMLSPRLAAHAALDAMDTVSEGTQVAGAESWLNELIWRDFYHDILFHFPQARQGSFRPQYAGIRWRNDPGEFEAWQSGRTGYPIVDAGMRQLLATGWMHNRARMITASFLVKDLLIDWRWGERWFMQNLIDGDPASNNGGWQWVAGTGTDAAPFFRIFNPVLQAKRFDPAGEYVRRWVPELNGLETGEIHEPWKLTMERQVELNVRIGREYPAPIVDHASARERTLAAYRLARDGFRKKGE